jgi:hypothetical protein
MLRIFTTDWNVFCNWRIIIFIHMKYHFGLSGLWCKCKLMSNDAYAAPQGAGFYSQTMQHMHQPVMTFLVQHFVFPPFALYLLFCKSLHKKIKSCNLSLGFFYIAPGIKLWHKRLNLPPPPPPLCLSLFLLLLFFLKEVSWF